MSEFLRYTDILPWSDDVAPHYGTLRAALEAKGVTIAPLDLMIAAHALAVDATTLVSGDQALARIDSSGSKTGAPDRVPLPGTKSGHSGFILSADRVYTSGKAVARLLS